MLTVWTSLGPSILRRRPADFQQGTLSWKSWRHSCTVATNLHRSLELFWAFGDPMWKGGETLLQSVSRIDGYSDAPTSILFNAVAFAIRFFRAEFCLMESLWYHGVYLFTMICSVVLQPMRTRFLQHVPSANRMGKSDILRFYGRAVAKLFGHFPCRRCRWQPLLCCNSGRGQRVLLGRSVEASRRDLAATAGCRFVSA